MSWRFLPAALLATAPVLSHRAPSPEDLLAGRRSYSLLCVQCHGEDGDAVTYPGVLPLAGIGRRYSPEVIGQLSGTFSGRFLYGTDREQLVAYLMTLRGSKGYADPGWLVTPYLLEKKFPLIHQVRVIDSRGERAYAAGHVPNAVSLRDSDCVAQSDNASWLADLGVTPATLIVVYDDTGGPSAACAWLRIRRAGHPWVAVLDGGWNRWTAERRATSAVVPRMKPTNYAPAASADRVRTSPSGIRSLTTNDWDWKATIDSHGFRGYEELFRLVERAGLRPGITFRMAAPPEQIAHVILVLHLLGFGVDYDAGKTTISITARS